MKRLAFLLTAVLLFISNSHTTWFTQNSGTTVTLNSVYFPVLNTGYIAGDNGTILKTVDKGASWLVLNSGTQRNLTSVFFSDENNGFIAGDSVILKTNNGGVSWGVYETDYLVKSVYFINSQLGFAAAYNGIVFKTINGGMNWYISYPSSQYANYTSIYFTNAQTGYVVGLGGRYLKTINGGSSWEQKPIDYSKNFYNITFLNEATGYIAGGWIAGAIMKSVDGGESWNHLLEPLEAVRFFSSSFFNVNNGMVAGRNGMILRTADAGNTWTEENSGTNAILYDIHFLNLQTAYTVGENGTILSTVSVIGINPVNSLIPEKFSLYQNYPNPFNPVTKIKFDIPVNVKSQTPNVKLLIYDLLGRETAILVNEELKPGIYEIDFDGSDLPSGTYFYRLQAGEYSETKSMIMLK